MRKDRHMPLKAALLGATMLCAASTAQASFIGDTIDWSIDIASVGNASGSLTPDPSDSAFSTIGELGVVLLSHAPSNNFYVSANTQQNNESGSGFELMLTDIDWLPDPGQISGITDIFGSGIFSSISSSNFVFGPDFVTVQFGAFAVGSDSFSDFGFVVEATHDVPEPATLAAFATGLLGVSVFAGRRKRRKRQRS